MNARRQKIGIINIFGVLVKVQKIHGKDYHTTYGDIDMLGNYDFGRQVKECQELAGKLLKTLNLN